MSGNTYKFYPNGKLYYSGAYTKFGKLTIDETRDSLGNILAVKGRGSYVKYSEDFNKVISYGSLSDGYEDGEWHGDLNDSVRYTLFLDKGVVKNGISYDNKGVEYPFKVLETEPVFPGGLGQFSFYIIKHLNYPKYAEQHNIQGKVYISFVVNKDGSLTNIKLLRGIGGGCDEEAVRILGYSPRWKPGTQYGIPVRVQYTIPINFDLPHKNFN